MTPATLFSSSQSIQQQAEKADSCLRQGRAGG
jgi:hypothetical protein